MASDRHPTPTATPQALARRALPLVDLTSLNDGDDADSTAALCRRARLPIAAGLPPVAAVCLWPSFVAQARDLLAGSGIKVATVVNFPGGSFPASKVVAQIDKALADGADEIDVVMPYHDLILHPYPTLAREVLAAARAACGARTMKVILETGTLAKPALVEKAGRLALETGADFLKTSTGKTPVGATPGAARVLLDLCREAADQGRTVGFKASGGIRDLDAVATYLDLADSICGPRWATPATFRFGASGLLDVLLATLGIAEDGAETADNGRQPGY